jgi:hypothetical protein
VVTSTRIKKPRGVYCTRNQDNHATAGDGSLEISRYLTIGYGVDLALSPTKKSLSPQLPSALLAHVAFDAQPDQLHRQNWQSVATVPEAQKKSPIIASHLRDGYPDALNR